MWWMWCAVLVGVVGAEELPAPFEGNVTGATWAPDGSALAARLHNNPSSLIFVQRVKDGKALGDPIPMQVPGASDGRGGRVGAAAWVDPSTLVVSAATSTSTPRLMVWTPGTGQPGELLRTTDVAGDLTAPVVHLPTKRIAFVATDGPHTDLYLFRPKNKKKPIRRLELSPDPELQPTIAPAGGQLAFVRDLPTDRDIFVIDLSNATAKAMPMAAGEGDQVRPGWVGDQQVVYFTDSRGRDQWDIAVAALDGTQKTVARDVRLPHHGSPPLTPDGRRVAHASTNPTERSIVHFTALDGTSAPARFDTGILEVSDISLVKAGSRVLMACTGHSTKGATTRTLHVFDVTAQLQ